MPGLQAFAVTVLSVGMLLHAPATADQVSSQEEGWREVREVDGVTVEALSGDRGFDEHRAHTWVCTDVESLAKFVADTAALPDWLPDTEEVRVLRRDSNAVIYYLRSATPWPMRSRDMVYRMERHTKVEPGTARLSITGLPDYLPAQANTVRMEAARGAWLLRNENQMISITFQMFVDPGDVARFFANRRMSWFVGRTVANLAARFPCDASSR